MVSSPAHHLPEVQPPSLKLLNTGSVWKKSEWSNLAKTNVTVYYERKMRKQALTNSKMQYLNVQVQGLSGIPHPALRGINTTQEVLRLRHHLKFLSCDYLTAERLFMDNGSNPQCKLCSAPLESIEHVLTKCRATKDIHGRMLPELLNAVFSVHSTCDILNIKEHGNFLTQFLLDCTSLNLPANCRIAAHNPRVGEIFSVSRNWCFAISRARTRLMKQLNESQDSLKRK